MKNPFDLYSGDPKLEEATEAMTKAVEAGIVEGKTIEVDEYDEDQDEAENAVVRRMMNKYVYPVMNKYAKAGASDTEPREIAFDKLHKGIFG